MLLSRSLLSKPEAPHYPETCQLSPQRQAASWQLLYDPAAHTLTAWPKEHEQELSLGRASLPWAGETAEDLTLGQWRSDQTGQRTPRDPYYACHIYDSVLLLF